MQRKTRLRTVIFLIIVVLAMLVFALRLYKLQVVQDDTAMVAKEADSLTYSTIVEASRGNILDRNGTVLVSNRVSYNLRVINYVLFNSKGVNDNLLALTELCAQLDIPVESHFPVQPERPYAYDMDSVSATWQNYFRTFLGYHSYDLDISAPTLMKNLREIWAIPDSWTQEQAYQLIRVRYELELRSIDGTGLENYTLATDVSAEKLAAVMELGVPGVIVESGTVREYKTAYAAHLLGYLSPIWSEDWEKYRDKGYSMNALVGRTGVELAFEDYLHGTSGLKYTTVSSTGEVLEQYYTTVPQPGNNLELTIDINLQAVAEKALEQVILNLRENGVGAKQEGHDAEGGAVVVQSCRTGEVLASASYPTYDITTFFDDYKELEADPCSPMLNRVLMATYPPGSIYKMVTAIADVDLGGMDPYYEIEDEGIYTLYKDEGFTPKCHVWSKTNPVTHGVEDLRKAIADSCNYYFYESGRLTYNAYYARTGGNPFDVVAKSLGLGEPTGIELPEFIGTRANAETKAQQYTSISESGWYGADILQAVIGQSINRFTPLQMVCYTSALANGGTRYEATLLSRVISWDYQTLLLEHTPVVASQLEISDAALAAVQEGMRMTATVGTAKSYLKDYPIEVCCKTGTAQWQNALSTGEQSNSDHASFVLYAPADDPEIAIAVYVEKGAQGGNLANVCIPILDAYFSTSTKYETVSAENTVH